MAKQAVPNPPNVVDGFKVINEFKLVILAGAAALAFLLTAGCAMPPFSGEDGEPAGSQAGQAADQETEAAADQASRDAGAAASSESELPEVELDGELMYQILVGEFAANRGDMEESAEALLEAAHRSRDPRLAQRATSVALEAERFDLAMDAGSLWVELSPGRDQPKESLALILVEQGRIAEAESRFAELLAAHEADRGEELRRIARLLGQLSNSEQALAVMQRLVSRYEDNADAHFALAFLADRVGDSDLVVESLERSLALRPGWEDAALAMLGHLIQGQFPRERIDAFSTGYLEEAPESHRVRISYARYLIDQEALDQALVQFREVLEYDPDNTTALLSAGLLSVQEEEYKDARKYLTRHLELTPDNDQIRLYLGQVAEEQERYDEAEKWYREIDAPEQRFDAQLRLATVIQERRGVEPALEHLDSVTPGDQQEFVRLALTKELVLRDADELPRAMSVLDDAVARYPGNTDLLYARGLLAAQLDRIVEHEKDMRALLEEDPNNAHALNALGYTLADATDRTQEAYDLIKKALAMRPDDPFILDSMGWVQYRLGNHRQAIEYLQKALDKRPDAEIAAHLGEVLWVTGEKEQAQEIWDRARQTDPDNRVLKETLERFGQ